MCVRVCALKGETFMSAVMVANTYVTDTYHVILRTRDNREAQILSGGRMCGIHCNNCCTVEEVPLEAEP